MRRRILMILMTMCMGASMLWGCGATTGGNAEGTYQVAIVKYVDDASLNQIEDAIEAQLRAKEKELGVTFDIKNYNGQADGAVLNQIAADILADEGVIDAVIPIATPAAVIMQAATADTDIPVIFSAVSNPVEDRLVADMNQPGANVTGTSDGIDTEAIFELMLLQNPNIKKVGLLYDKSQSSSLVSIADAKAFCQSKGIAVVEKTGTSVSEIQTAADVLVAEQVEVVFTPQDNTVMQAELAIYEKFTEAKIPHYTGADSFALNGAFLGFGVNYENLGTLTADMVIDILVKGAKVAETPVQKLQEGILTINVDTADVLGIDYNVFKEHCDELKEIKTGDSF